MKQPRGLEMARSDWTLLVRRFQGGLLYRIFQGEPYKESVVDYARDTPAEHKGDQLRRQAMVKTALPALISQGLPN